MGDYTRDVEIHRPADEVLAYVSDIWNMPGYLPTVRIAAPQGEGRVVVEGEVDGHHYRSDGWLDLDMMARMMRWGSDGERDYRGEMRLHDLGGGRTRLELRLHLVPTPEEGRRFARQSGDGDAGATIERGMDAALRAIKAQCEATAPDRTEGVELRSGGWQAKPDDDRLLGDSRAYGGSSATMNPPDLSRG
jgi:hypothetical protein